MASTLGRMLLNLLVTWSCKMALQTKNTISPLPTTVLMPVKLGRMMANLEGLLPIMLLYPLVIKSCEITPQTKKIFPWPQCLWLPSHTVTLPFGHVVLWDHIANQKHISTTTVPMVTRLRRMVACLEGLLLIMLFYLLIIWSCEITW